MSTIYVHTQRYSSLSSPGRPCPTPHNFSLIYVLAGSPSCDWQWLRRDQINEDKYIKEVDEKYKCSTIKVFDEQQSLNIIAQNVEGKLEVTA